MNREAKNIKGLLVAITVYSLLGGLGLIAFPNVRPMVIIFTTMSFVGYLEKDLDRLLFRGGIYSHV